MYRKEEIVLVGSPIIYARYVLAHDNVTFFSYDYSLNQDILPMERVNTLSMSLFNNQFSVDEDKSAFFIAPSIVGTWVRMIYYTEGDQNPFYASSNLHKFITQVLKWTSSRISEGIYLYWEPCDPVHKKLINEGSFVYENQFYVYHGGVFDIKMQAPPTLRNTYKCYYLFINQEILDSYLDRQSRMLSEIGILPSSTSHLTLDAAKLDVLTRYTNMYDSEPLEVAFVHIQLNDQLSYNVWIEYPTTSRTL
jgi:hypothetical protein